MRGDRTLMQMIRGTLSRHFRIGPGGPQLRADSDGGLAVRSSTDGAYAVMRGGQPAGSDDLTTLGFGDTRYRRISSNAGTLTRAAGAGSGSEVVTHGLVAAPQVIDLLGSADADPMIGSSGSAHGAGAQGCMRSTTLGIASLDLNNVLNIQGAGAGWTATISAVSTTTFTVAWVTVGAGANVTVRWLARM